MIAKAVDAGYRLIIVLTGPWNCFALRRSAASIWSSSGRRTSFAASRGRRRAPEERDYQDDRDWDSRFVELGGLPSTRNESDIIRLTSHRFDYKSLKAGIVALEFEKVDNTKPLYAIDNLPSSNARLAVVKKNKAVLQKLVRDLKSIKTERSEIPVFIIDDESDQASVNTTNPNKWQGNLPGQAERSAINRLVSELLTLLPRAQYVGYTATPFANVFIDPSDVEDIYPKDFIVSLGRPDGYMGISDFHDIGTEVEPHERTFGNSNEKAYVRDLHGGAGEALELQRAIDSFVLSGR